MNTDTTLSESLNALERYANGDESAVVVKTVKIATPPCYTPTDVKEIRDKIAATQRTLARILSVSPRTVEAWETGRSTPNGSARRLLELIASDPSIVQRILA